MAVRNNIVNRISLEGGDEVRRKFEGLGKAGKDAFEQLQRAGEEARGRALGAAFRAAIDRAVAKMKELAAAARNSYQAFRNFGGALGGLGSSFLRVGRNIALLGGAVAGAAAGFGAFIKSGTDLIDTLGKAAQATGLAIDEYGRLQFAAAQSGVEQAGFNSSLNRFNRAVGEAAQGVKTYVEPFQKLGISLRDSNGRLKSTNDLFIETAAAIGRLPDGVNKSAVALELFGRSGAALIPLFNAGASGIRALGAEAEQLGVVFTPEQFKAAENFNDQLSRVQKSFRAISAKALLPLAGTLEVLAGGFQNFLVNNQAAIQRFGTLLAINVTQAILDLIYIFDGEESKVVNRQFLEWRDSLEVFVTYVREGIDIVKSVFSGILGVADSVAGALNSVFDTDLTGRTVLIGAAVLKLVGAFQVLGATLAVVRTAFAFFGTLGPLLLRAGGLLASFFGTTGVLATGAALIKALGVALLGIPGLVVAAVAGAVFLIYKYWDEVKAGAAATWEFIKQTATDLAPVLQAVFSSIVSAAGAAWEAVKSAAGSALSGLGSVIDGALATAAPAFDRIRDAAGAAWQAVKDQAGEAVEFVGRLLSGDQQAIDTFFTNLQTAAETGWTLFRETSTAAWTAAIEAAQAAQLALQPVFDFIRSTGGALFDGIATAAANVWTTVVSNFEGARDFVVGVLSSIGSALAAAWQASIEGIAGAAEAISAAIERATQIAGDVAEAERIAEALVAPFRRVKSDIEAIWTGIAQFIRREVQGIVSEVQSLVSALQRELSRLQSAISSARSSARSGSSGGSSESGFASGGYVRGPGTGTSDSIPALLSNGEFVIRAAAVRKYGTSLISALNAMRLPRGAIPRFAAGGLVQAVASVGAPMRALAPLTPAVQSAGSSLRPLTLNIGGESFGGLYAEEATAERMASFATGRALRSAGRKPGFIGR